ncbi:hypothetical protein ACO0QE_001143 [Hanseniaspora vineae]
MNEQLRKECRLNNKYNVNLEKFEQLTNRASDVSEENRANIANNANIAFDASNKALPASTSYNVTKAKKRISYQDQLNIRKRDGVKSIYKVITPRIKTAPSTTTTTTTNTTTTATASQHSGGAKKTISEKSQGSASLFKKPSSTLFNKTTFPAHIPHTADHSAVKSAPHTTNMSSAAKMSPLFAQKSKSLFNTPQTSEVNMNSNHNSNHTAQPTHAYDPHKVYYSSDEDIYSTDEDTSSSEIYSDEDNDYEDDYYNHNDNETGVMNLHPTNSTQSELSRTSTNVYPAQTHDMNYQKKWGSLMLRKYNNKRSSSDKHESSMVNGAHQYGHGHGGRDLRDPVTEKKLKNLESITQEMLLDNQSSITHSSNDSGVRAKRLSASANHIQPANVPANVPAQNNQVLFRRGSFGSMVSEATRKRYVHPSNAPPTAQTLLPIAFQTHMFVPNDISLQRQEMEQKKILLYNDEDDLAVDPDMGKFANPLEQTVANPAAEVAGDSDEEIEEESLFYSEVDKKLKKSDHQQREQQKETPVQRYATAKYNGHRSFSPHHSLFTGGRTRG